MHLLMYTTDSISLSMNAEYWRASVLCRIAGTLAITSSEASVLFVTLISIDRFITIKFPYSIHKLRVKSDNSDFYDNSHVCIGLPLAQIIYPKIQTKQAVNMLYWEGADTKTVQVVESFDQSPGFTFQSLYSQPSTCFASC